MPISFTIITMGSFLATIGSSGILSSNVTFVTCKSLVLRICDEGANQLSEEIAHSSDATGRAHGYVLRGRAPPHTPADADESAEQRFGRGFSAMVSTVPSPSSSGRDPRVAAALKPHGVLTPHVPHPHRSPLIYNRPVNAHFKSHSFGAAI